MLDWLGDVVYRRARLVLVVAGIFVAAAGILAAGVFDTLKVGGYLDPEAESSIAAERIDAAFGGQYNLVFLVEAEGRSLDDPAVAAEGLRLTRELASEDGVGNVVSYWSTGSPALTSSDGSSAVVAAHVDGDEDAALRHTQRLHDAYADRDGVLSVRVGGEEGVNREIFQNLQHSLVVAEAVAVPVSLLLLVLAFGSVVAALLPLVIGILAIVGTFGELAVLGGITDMSVLAANLTTALGLGLGIDYALLMVARFRERLTAGDAVPEAVATTVRTAGRTILYSALIVAAALATMAVFPLYFLRSFAYAGVGVVFIAALASLFVVPALLSLLGGRVNALRLPWSKAVRGSDAPFWGRLADRVNRRPALAGAPVLLVLLVLASPLLHAEFGTVDDRVLRPSAESRSVNDALDAEFTGFDASALQVVLEGPVRQPALAGYARELSARPEVTHVESSAGTFAEGRLAGQQPTDAARGTPDTQWLTLSTDLPPKTDATADLVRAVRATPGPDGSAVLVGGADAELIDTRAALAAKLPLAVAIIVLITFVVLFLFTGSLLQPVRALILNGLSLAATFGVLVWAFQDGHLAGLLGFTPQPIDTANSILIFCVVFGLSMDYEVFLISRIKEMHDAGYDTATAVSRGLARTGRIVSVAAGLLAVVFFSFLTGTLSFLQLFGLGAGIAILIDAILVRGVLVPGAIAVLGRAAWWSPPALRRLHRRVRLAEE
ncbi:putative drug exporter of the RND superfamily [Amycolatopsis arida]|uniref:Putative drug exporter of the RND superfamily n=1 Tax=Amycolatopsis arida TaxID=587909 RepID=A0A1I5V7N8_9PSEU|nr:MMPL family transporter [Amycolatopsis arida]TDX91180.1 RND superfamily putative drug exporter [Amycolatopsis arida]SFQ03529.1 putative drug exporter of the RND superfamily [Amycolatopsis arida]